MKKLLLLLFVCLPVHAQTGPGNIQPPSSTTALNAVTTNTNSSALSVKLYGAVGMDVVITGGTVNVNVKGRIDSSGTFRTLTGTNAADGSTITTITASGFYVFPTAGMEDVEVFTTGISGATVTVKLRQIPSVGKAIPSAGGSGTGNVVGAASSTDNAITRFDGTGGKTIQNSAATIDDSGNLAAVAGTFSGKVTTNAALVQPNTSLTDNGTVITTNAALGNNFRVTALTANVTLSNPTNPTDGQIVTWEIIQHASAAKTLAFDTKFAFGAEITACTISTTTSSHNFITAIYNSTADKWYVRGCLTGF